MVIILPFCDLVLMSSSSAAAIIFGVILSVFWLNETFVWRYDMTAVLVIILGSFLTVLQSNKVNQIYTLAQLHALTHSLASIVYLSTLLLLLTLTAIAYNYLMSRLKRFHVEICELLQ